MSEVSFTAVDVVVVIVVLASATYATIRGLLSETLSVFAWALAAYCSLRFYRTFLPMVSGHIDPPWLATAITVVGIFLIVLIPLSFIGHRFAETVQRSEIGPLDRTLGFVFGVGRALVIIGLAYIAYTMFMPMSEHPEWLAKARTLPLIQDTSEILLSLVPDEKKTRDAVQNEIDRSRSGASSGSGDTAVKSYGTGDRRALDRLIGTTGER